MLKTEKHNYESKGKTLKKRPTKQKLHLIKVQAKQKTLQLNQLTTSLKQLLKTYGLLSLERIQTEVRVYK